MSTTAHWRRLGTAYILRDEYSTLYAKRSGSRYHLMARNPNPIQGGWLTLGTYRTLRDVQRAGLELMQEVSA